MVFQGTELSFYATESLCLFMEPLTTLIGEIVRALEPPEHQQLYWVDRHGDAGALRDWGESGSLYPAWSSVLDEHHGVIPELLMYSPSGSWGLWMRLEFEIAMLGIPSDTDPLLRARIEEYFSPSIEDFVDNLMRPLGPLNPQWQADLDSIVVRYGPNRGYS